MKKLTILLLICLLTTSVFGQWQSGVKPLLGRQVNWAHPLSKGLVGLWLFNEGSGDIVNDLSGNGKTGTLQSGVSWSISDYGWCPYGVQNNSGIITDLYSASWDNGFSIIVRITPDSNLGTSDYIVDDSNGSVGLAVRTDSSDATKLDFFTYPGPCILEPTTAFLAVNTPTVIGVIHGPTANHLYKDGTYIDSDSTNFTLAIADSASPLAFLSEYNSQNAIPAKIDYILVYNCALSASEIAQLYSMPFCMFEGDLTVAQMYDYSGAPPAPSSQFIMIQMTAIPFSIIIIIAISPVFRKWKSRYSMMT